MRTAIIFALALAGCKDSHSMAQAMNRNTQNACGSKYGPKGKEFDACLAGVEIAVIEVSDWIAK